MKKNKIICLLSGLLFSLSLVGCNSNWNLGGTIVKPESSEDQQSYIEDIKICGAYWKRYSSNAASRLNSRFATSENEYSYIKVENIDLNSGCGTTSDCNYLYETRTYDKSKAIRNIAVVVRNTESGANWFVDDYGDNYYCVDGIRVNGLDSSTTYYSAFNVNKGAGGKYIYLYYTRDTNRSNLEPITSLDIAKGAYDTIANYTYLTNSDPYQPLQDLNEGSGGDDIFFGFNRDVTGWEIFDLQLIDYDTSGNQQTKIIKLDTKDKKIKAEYLWPYLSKGGGSNFGGYTYRDGTEVCVDDVIEYNNTEIYAKWTYNLTVNYSFYDKEDKIITNLNYLPDLTEDVYKGYRNKGWRFEDQETRISTALPLRRGGEIVPILERVHVQDYSDFVTGYNQGGLFTEYYNVYTMYSVLFRNKLESDRYREAGFRCGAYTNNFEIKDGMVYEATSIPTPVTSSLDYSDLDADELTRAAMTAKFLMMVEEDDIQNTIDYYKNEGKVDSNLDEIILDLCAKELARR